jgi:hypothetical protein
VLNQLIADGGPEVVAAASAVLSAPDSWMGTLLQFDLHKARQRDADAAAHAAAIDALIGKADQSAATARQDAARAAEAAATARGAADEAAGHANAAQQHADTAAQHATRANQHALRAQASAAQAAASAQTALDAARQAQHASVRARSFANQAAMSARSARSSANVAHAEALAAASSALAAGKSAAEAAEAARAAAEIAMHRLAAEDAARRRAAQEQGTTGAVTVPVPSENRSCDANDMAPYRYVESDRIRYEGYPSKPYWCLDDIADVVVDRSQVQAGNEVVLQYVRGLNGMMSELRTTRPWIELVGFVPIAGDFADGVLCMYDIATAEPAEAALTCFALVPVVGSAVKPGWKWTWKGLEWLHDAQGIPPGDRRGG